ncbi:MAG: hypothetical protein Q4F06_06180 [Eubacteriales bacterium]|nr:hypothetical protein [Eubacteriales bacterium]
MVDSSYFKNSNNSNKGGGKLIERLKKYPFIPLLVVIVLAFALLALSYIMIDIQQYAYSLYESETSSMIDVLKDFTV